MDTWIVVVFALVFTGLYFWTALPIFNLVQLEGYRYIRSKKLERLYVRLICLFALAYLLYYIFCMIALLSGYGFLQFVAPVVTAILLIQTSLPKRGGCKRQPLVYTKRMKRLLGCFFALLAAVTTGAAVGGKFLAVQGLRLYFALVPAVIALLPVLALIALKAMAPAERAINNTYIKACKRELESRENLIKIGVTGSYGKTSVKLFLTHILSKKFRTFCTPHNYNTPMGMCLAVNQMPADTQIFVAEMGARFTGDIRELCEIVRPQYAVLTGVGTQHLETFGSPENIAAGKYELIEALPKNGFAVFNGESDRCRLLYEQCAVPKALVGADGYCRAEDVVCSAEGSAFTLVIGEERAPCRIRLIGRHNIVNVLLAAATAQSFGMSCAQIAAAAADIPPVGNRLEVSKLGGGVTVIDDSYNANEEGARIAVDALAMFEGRKIIASQGMVELGSRQNAANFELGEYMADKADVVILVGPNAEIMRMGLLSGGMCEKNIFVRVNLEEAKSLFTQMLRPGDVLLLQNDLTDNY